MIRQERLKELLHYCPETGAFTRLIKTSNRIKIGSVAGYARPGCRLVISVDGKLYHAHRLAWFWMTGEWPKDQINHINGVRDDNRWDNLREATRSQNQQNRKVNSNNKSGYMGVSWQRRAGKWVAHIKIAGCNRYLGLFTTPEDAHAAYLAAKAEHHQFQPTVRTT